MTTAVLGGLGALAGAPPGASAAPPDRRPERRRRGLLPAVAVAVLALLVAAGNSKTMLLGLGIIAAGVVLANCTPRPVVDPIELSATVLLAIVTAVPFAKLPHNRTTSVVAVVALLAVGMSALVRAPLQPLTWGSVLVAGLFGVLAVSTMLSPDAGGIKRLITMSAAALPGFFLGVRLTAARLRTISCVLLALSLVESLMAIAEPVVFPKHLWVSAAQTGIVVTAPLKNSLFPSIQRSQGSFGHPLPLGILLVVGLALLISVLVDMKLWARLSCGVVLLVGLLFTGDRSCLLAAFLLLIAGSRVTLGRVLGSLGAAVAAVLFLVDVGAINSSLVSHFAQSGSYLHRASAYSLIWRLFSTQQAAASFGGNGFGSTQRLFDEGLLQTDGFKVVDNQFVLIQSQGGVICLLLLASIAVLAIFTASSPLRGVVLFVVAVSVIFDWLSWPSDSALIFLLLGAGLASRRQSETSVRADPPERPLARFVPRPRWASPEG